MHCAVCILTTSNFLKRNVPKNLTLVLTAYTCVLVVNIHLYVLTCVKYLAMYIRVQVGTGDVSIRVW